MRLHDPRDSPSSTREFGPIDATMRELRLAPDRITTQCRDTERIHRVCRRAVDVAEATDLFDAARGLDVAAIGFSGGAIVVVGSADATERVIGCGVLRAGLGAGAVCGTTYGAIGSAGVVGTVALVVLAGGALSRIAVSVLAIVTGVDTLSTLPAVVRDVAVSAFTGADADRSAGLDRWRIVS